MVDGIGGNNPVNKSTQENKNKQELTQEEKLELFDTDENGILDDDETDYMNKLMGTVEGDMDKYDTDGDGSFKQSETKSWLNRFLVTILSPFTSPGLVGNHMNMDEMYEKYDLNGDGELDLYEMAKMNKDKDVDHDGSISDAEASEYIAEQDNNCLRQDGEWKPGFGPSAGDTPNPNG